MSRFLYWLTKRMAGVAWSKRLSVGNAILDSEHKNLISQINEIMRLIEARESIALASMLEAIEISMDAHFANEELFARAVNFDFSLHRLTHQHLLADFRKFKHSLAEKNGVWADSEIKLYYSFLHDWLIGHIAAEDMQMKQALESYPYDFLPEQHALTHECNADCKGIGSGWPVHVAGEYGSLQHR